MEHVENPIISDQHPVLDPMDRPRVEQCAQCGKTLTEGTETLVMDDIHFCDMHCLQDNVLENIEYEEEII
ncbi:hypothetical protein [Alkalicoccus chagannorensis]|uniref:hypothetical protein n=1 Tax=Alkalicoccus chagannorensis TaxID=427072 RepID=UPI0004045B99|nr:hypothetical protein [Alkalicoccus chagannorensis]